MTAIQSHTDPHLWRSSKSPAELIELAGGVEKNRGVLKRWAVWCHHVWNERTDRLMRYESEYDSDVEFWIRYSQNDYGGNLIKHSEQVSMLRCLILNPFAERVTCPRCKGEGTLMISISSGTYRATCPSCNGSGTTQAPFREEWRTSTVVDLARMVRGNPLAFEIGTNKPIGWEIGKEPRFDLMPILADALMDAGCDDEDILEHCRGECHCEGCWVIEQIVG